jgi:hypothetical protein
MSKFNINGSNMENLLFINNTTGTSIGLTKYYTNSVSGFPNKYKAKIGSSKYSYTNIGYLVSGVDEGTKLSPKITVLTSSNSTFALQTNTTKILCICLGGGAGGTGGNYSSGGGESGGGGGGGGGGGMAYVLYDLDSSKTINVTVGGGGSAGSEGDPIGTVGTDGGNSTVVYNGSTLCTGNGGKKGLASSSNNNGSYGGPSTTGSVIDNTNVLDSGTKVSAPGGDGQDDPENGSRSQNGEGGVGANGGTTTYPYGCNGSSKSNLTIPQLTFDSLNFLDDSVILDPTNNSSFLATYFKGTAGGYGRGGNGGNGEGRNNGMSENGVAGGQGFVVIVEYGI